MKKMMVLAVFLAACVPVGASEWDKLLGDTKEVIGKHYAGSYGFNFLGDEAKQKLGIGSQVIAWRILGLEPGLTYKPNVADRRVDVEIKIPLRLGRFPIGVDRDLRDLFPGKKIGGWVDRLSGGFFLTYNITDGSGFNVGWSLNFSNSK